jgi:hypothetical protein
MTKIISQDDQLRRIKQFMDQNPVRMNELENAMKLEKVERVAGRETIDRLAEAVSTEVDAPISADALRHFVTLGKDLFDTTPVVSREWLKVDSYPADVSARVRPSTEWKEVYLDGAPEKEAEKFKAWAAEHAAIQAAIGQKAGKVMRGQHAGAMAGVKVQLEVLENIPEFAKHGIFAKPGTLTGVARFSNGAGVPSADQTKPDTRGVAMTLKGADGKPQDFLMVNTDAFFKNMEEVMTMVRASVAMAMVPPEQAPAKAFEVAAKALGPERAKFLLERRMKNLSRPVQSLATEAYFSMMPIKVGPYAAKVGLRPVALDGKSLGSGPTYLTDDLKARLAKGDVVFEMGLQFYENDGKTPIEDLSAPWDVPFVPVARMVIPKQDLDSEAGKALAKELDGVAISPWNTEDHSPLGEIGRARKEVYSKSAETRGGCPYKGGV